jgi:hypothetical protein
VNPQLPNPGLAEAVSALLNGTILDRQRQRLNQLFAEDSAAIDYYLRHVFVVGFLREGIAAAASDAGASAGVTNLPIGQGLSLESSDIESIAGLDDAMVLPGISGDEPSEEVCDYTESSPLQEGPAPPSHQTARPRSKFPQSPKLRGIAAALVLAAGAVAIALLVRGAASQATVASAVNAQFDDPRLSCAPGTPLPSGRRLNLTAGDLELALSGGAGVVVEAPASLTIESATAISLQSGKISVTAAGRAHGFVVKTRQATLTDLGTEFGVFVDPSGVTRVDVFSGKVQVDAAGQGDSTGQQQLVTTGASAQASAGLVTVTNDGASPQLFVCSVVAETRELDLVDLLAGGNGTTHRRGAGIDPVTGLPAVIPAPLQRVGDTIYHRVPNLPVIDGCFIPNGRRGPIAVDSAGDTFAFPVTDGKTAEYIWAGGKLPPHANGLGTPMSGRLGTVDYAQTGHGLIFIHSNGGITFDLDAIRRLHPNATLDALHFIAGNSRARPLMKADLFAIVDGVLRFQRRGFVCEDCPFVGDVPLRAGDRFLTLASTDGGDGNSGDWILLGDPTIRVSGGSDTKPANEGVNAVQ